MSHSNAHELLASTASRIEGAYAPSTIRAYRSDFAEFIGFCESNGLVAFPPDPVTLAEFIGHVSEKGRSSATIRRAIAGISTIYRLNRMPDPSKDPEVIIRSWHFIAGVCGNKDGLCEVCKRHIRDVCCIDTIKRCLVFWV